VNRRDDTQAKHFRIGVVQVSLSTPLRGVLRQYANLYRHFETDEPADREICVEVRPTRFSLRHRRRYEVSVNKRLQFEPTRREEILPYVDWAVNWEVPRVMPEYLQLHASSMEVDGAGVIFPGHSGCGKSTLTAGLLTRGWRYLCDEFALIHADTLALHPYPRAICIKKPSYPVVESLGLKIRGRRYYVKSFKGHVGFVSPVETGLDALGRSCPIRYVIFPRYVAGAEPLLVPLTRAEAAFALHEVCFNLFTCRVLGLDVLTAMIRGAVCYRLTCREINATCDLLQSLVESSVIPHARSA
jgi:HprK-related kinase A